MGALMWGERPFSKKAIFAIHVTEFITTQFSHILFSWKNATAGSDNVNFFPVIVGFLADGDLMRKKAKLK